MKRFVVLAVTLLVAGAVARSEEFTWSGEKGVEQGDRKMPARNTNQPGSFDWSVDDEIEKGTTTRKSVGGPGIDPDAYNELLQENLKLRKDLEEVAKGEKQVRKEKDQLALKVDDLERRIGKFTQMISDLKKQQSGADAGAVGDLESNLSATPASAVKPGSGLFRKLEQENALLKKKLAAAQSEKESAATASEDAVEGQAELRAKLAAAQEAEKTSRKKLNQLKMQIPALRGELSELEGGMAKKDSELLAREQALETLNLELERRERRIVKAERITKLIEDTRSEVQWRDDMQKRDMHYNMATVYAREGHHEAAEKEYLRALRIDPTHADTHHKLGTLYEKGFKNIRRAAMHYRKYLKLNPAAADVDQVRLWLLESESAMK